MNRAQKVVLATGILLIALTNIAIPSGASFSHFQIFLITAGLPLFILCAASLIWIYRDARHRGKNAWLVLGLSLFFWPLGHLAWICFRPEKSRHLRRRRSPLAPQVQSTLS